MVEVEIMAALLGAEFQLNGTAPDMLGHKKSVKKHLGAMRTFPKLRRNPLREPAKVAFGSFGILHFPLPVFMKELLLSLLLTIQPIGRFPLFSLHGTRFCKNIT